MPDPIEGAAGRVTQWNRCLDSALDLYNRVRLANLPPPVQNAFFAGIMQGLAYAAERGPGLIPVVYMPPPLVPAPLVPAPLVPAPLVPAPLAPVVPLQGAEESEVPAPKAADKPEVACDAVGNPPKRRRVVPSPEVAEPPKVAVTEEIEDPPLTLKQVVNLLHSSPFKQGSVIRYSDTLVVVKTSDGRNIKIDSEDTNKVFVIVDPVEGVQFALPEPPPGADTFLEHSPVWIAHSRSATFIHYYRTFQAKDALKVAKLQYNQALTTIAKTDLTVPVGDRAYHVGDDLPWGACENIVAKFSFLDAGAARDGAGWPVLLRGINFSELPIPTHKRRFVTP